MGKGAFCFVVSADRFGQPVASNMIISFLIGSIFMQSDMSEDRRGESRVRRNGGKGNGLPASIDVCHRVLGTCADSVERGSRDRRSCRGTMSVVRFKECQWCDIEGTEWHVRELLVDAKER